jgi:hypothetical protein
VSPEDSYLVRVIRMLGLNAITILGGLSSGGTGTEATMKTESFREDELPTDPSS